MSKHTHPKETPKAQPSPTEHETQFFRHPVKTTRYHSQKPWFKIAVTTLLLAVLGGMGTWVGTTSLDWLNHHHAMTDQQQADLNRWHWQIPRLQEAYSNLVEQQNQAVGRNRLVDTNSLLTAQAK